MFGMYLMLALRSPLQDPRCLQKCLVGGALVLVPTVLLPSLLSESLPIPAIFVGVLIGLALVFAVWGYVYRIFVDSLNEVEGPVLPAWQLWKVYILAGIWLFLIVLGYLIIAAFGMFGLISILGVMPTGDDPQQLSGILFLMMLVSMLLYSFLPIAFARFAAERKVWASFEPWTIWKDIRRIVRGEYIQACFGFYGLLLVGNVILGQLPFVGLPLVSLYVFYLTIVFAQVFGRMIGNANRDPRIPQQTD